MHPKKPQRKSLPTLLSQKISSASAPSGCITVSSKAIKEENHTTIKTNEKNPSNSNKQAAVSNATNEENIPIPNETNEFQSSVPDGEPSERQLFTEEQS